VTKMSSLGGKMRRGLDSTHPYAQLDFLPFHLHLMDLKKSKIKSMFKS
jgi:hypothetical protein